MNKMKTLVSYHYSQFVKPLVVSYTLFFILTLILTGASILQPIEGLAPEMGAQLDLLGLNVISFMIMGVIASLYHNRGVNNLIQNGFTRKEIYISKVISIITLAITMSVLNFGTQIIQSIIYKTPLFSNVGDQLAYHGVLILIYTLIGIIFTFFAIFVTRFGTRKSFILYLGLFFGGQIASFTRNLLFTEAQQAWIMNTFFGFIPQRQLPVEYLFIPFSVMTVITLSASYLIMRKTDITA